MEALGALGARIESLDAQDSMPLRTLESPLRGGVVQVPGDVSSQFVSALLSLQATLMVKLPSAPLKPSTTK